VTAPDEMVDGQGGVRPHWRGLLGAISAIGADALAACAARLDQADEEPGWAVDPVPLPLPAAEFAVLAEGLTQRAGLLEALLGDIYGAQRTLEAGLLPTALVYASPAFQRPCRSLPGPFLHAYAADLVRGPDRRWRVLADRLDAAPGIGSPGENRRRLARVLPELFRPVPIRPLRPFYEMWQAALARASGGGPAALLTPGSQDGEWPEHLALARELGCALVETRDLTVRGGAVMLKTLRGLRPLGALLRRVGDAALDPLELGGDGAGVPGLLDAARAGRVRILNAPGTAVAEAPGVIALMPQLAEALLGETLRLESAAEEARSTAPCAAPAGLDARPVLLRFFLVHDGAAWRAMPGGLAWATEAGTLGRVKDVWIESEEAREPAVRATPRPAMVPVQRAAGDFPSRVADDFFWLGRHLERLDSQARLGAAALVRAGRGAPLPRDLAEAAILASCLEQTGVALGGGALDGLRMAFAPAGALMRGLEASVRLLAGLRDRLTRDMHAALQHALRRARRMGEAAARRGGADALASAIAAVQALSTLAAGIAAENMVRAGGWLFLDLGRRIERAQALAMILATVLDQPAVRLEGALRLALELGDGLLTYQARYDIALQPGPALDLLLADPGNPRALGFQFARAAERLAAIEGGAPVAAEASRLHAECERLARGCDPPPAALRTLAAGAEGLSDEVTRRFLALLPRSQAVGLELA